VEQFITVSLHEMLEAFFRLFSTAEFLSLEEVEQGLKDPKASGIFAADKVKMFWALEPSTDTVLYSEMTPALMKSLDTTFTEFLGHKKQEFTIGCMSKNPSFIKQFDKYAGEIETCLIQKAEMENSPLPYIAAKFKWLTAFTRQDDATPILYPILCASMIRTIFALAKSAAPAITEVS
jgi:hypothetical protein